MPIILLMAKIVHITFFSDSLEGSRLVQLENHVCQLYDIKREDDAVLKQLSDNLDTPALYVLLNRKSNRAYIGQTDSFIQRITHHMAKKDFWDEVLAFIASDGSISATEVQYLEATAYGAARDADAFDLSENSQVPQPHKITTHAKIKSQDFFNVVCDLSKIVGCTLFTHGAPEKRHPTISHIKAPVKHVEKKEEDSLRGTKVKILLNGNGPYNKRKFVLAVVKDFIQTHPNATISQLKEFFPKTLLGSWDNWNFIETDIEAAKNLVNSGNSSTLRHFVNDVLTSPGDGVKFVVASQWDYKNLPNILSLVKRFGWEYKIVQRI